MVDAIEAWQQQQRQAVAGQLSLTPGAAQHLLELLLDEDHLRGRGRGERGPAGEGEAARFCTPTRPGRVRGSHEGRA